MALLLAPPGIAADPEVAQPARLIWVQLSDGALAAFSYEGLIAIRVAVVTTSGETAVSLRGCGVPATVHMNSVRLEVEHRTGSPRAMELSFTITAEDNHGELLPYDVTLRWEGGHLVRALKVLDGAHPAVPAELCPHFKSQPDPRRAAQ